LLESPVLIYHLQKIENLDALVNLEELWLGKNKITKLEVSKTSPLTHMSNTTFNLTEHGEFEKVEDSLSAVKSYHKVGGARELGKPRATISKPQWDQEN
jgi:hypothetical protein